MKICSTIACVASAMVLQSCSPEPTNKSFVAITATSDRIIADMAPLIYAKLDTLPAPSKQRRSVALVFTRAGVPPPDATCVADLRVAFERQLGALAERVDISLQSGIEPEEATVVFVVGDTSETNTQSPRVKMWMLAGMRSAPGSTSEFSKSLWFPGHSSADFLRGVYTDAAGRLVSGVSFVHWRAMQPGPKGEGCSINFIERLAYLYSLALKEEFSETYTRIGREARMRVGTTAYEVSSADVENLELGLYFCAQFVVRTKLAACALQMVKLISEIDRDHRKG